MDNVFDPVREQLFKAADKDYLAFQSGLIPGDREAKMIGVRTPVLRSLAKELLKTDDAKAFMSSLPHDFFEENQIHAFIISEMKDPGECFKAIEAFLPYVDNWATCDQMTPRSFKKAKPELLSRIDKWLASDHVFTRRFGIKMLMSEFLDNDFDPAFPEKVASVDASDYYVMMMVAWYFATALAKQYDCAIKYIEKRRLSPEAHRKTIRKACESFRISDEQKEYLRSLK
ncbi:MAG: DNA alkylation repair protein [Clostridia bacterium]|nr:DNA alkylation repair protein [Clostridia bacterium]